MALCRYQLKCFNLLLLQEELYGVEKNREPRYQEQHDSLLGERLDIVQQAPFLFTVYSGSSHERLATSSHAMNFNEGIF